MEIFFASQKFVTQHVLHANKFKIINVYLATHNNILELFLKIKKYPIFVHVCKDILILILKQEI